MGLLNDIIEQHKINIFNKQTLWENKHKLTVTSLELVDGKFGKQWKVALTNHTTENEEGFAFWSDKSEFRNKVFTALSEHIAKNGASGPVAISGKMLEEAKGPLKPATYSFNIIDWEDVSEQ